MNRTSRGVTLIELIVVMAILSVMLAIVGPRVSTGLDSLVLNSTARRVVAAFRTAQTSARSTGVRIFTAYDKDGIRFVSGDRTYQTIGFSGGVQLASPQGPATVVFLASGQVLGPDTLELTNTHRRRLRLSINHATGLVKLTNGN